MQTRSRGILGEGDAHVNTCVKLWGRGRGWKRALYGTPLHKPFQGRIEDFQTRLEDNKREEMKKVFEEGSPGIVCGEEGDTRRYSNDNIAKK